MTKAPYLRPVAAYAIIALTLGVVAGSFAWVAGWIYWPFAPPPLTAARMIDVFESTTRKHPGFRRNHAKGLCVSGHFDSTGAGAQFSRASVFKPGSFPFIGRLSAPGSDPTQEDADAPVRSFALKMSLPQGEEWRTAMNSVPIFAVSTPDALYQQLAALQPDAASGRVDPAKMERFREKHPETRAFTNGWRITRRHRIFTTRVISASTRSGSPTPKATRVSSDGASCPKPPTSRSLQSTRAIRISLRTI